MEVLAFGVHIDKCNGTERTEDHEGSAMFLLLKAGQEGQYKLLQCGVRCFGDHAVSPE